MSPRFILLVSTVLLFNLLCISPSNAQTEFPSFTFVQQGFDYGSAKNAAQAACEEDVLEIGLRNTPCSLFFAGWGYPVYAHLEYEVPDTYEYDDEGYIIGVATWRLESSKAVMCSEPSVGGDGIPFSRNCSQHYFPGVYPGYCPDGTSLDTQSGECDVEIPSAKDNGDPNCCDGLSKAAGNPINFTNGNKYQRESDYLGSGPFPLSHTRHFNTSTGWTSFYGISISIESRYQVECYGRIELQEFGCEYVVNATFEVADVTHPEGKVIRFKRSEGGVDWHSDADIPSQLEESGTGYIYMTWNDEVVNFNSSGKVESVTSREGISQTYAYPSDQVVVAHDFGRSLIFDLDGQGRMTQLTDPAGEIYQYVYNASGLLSYVLYPNGDRRDYHYNVSNDNALDQVFDDQTNYAVLWYYGSGRAYRSIKYGFVESFTVDYSAINAPYDPRVTVTNPLGKQTTYRLQKIHGVQKVVEAERLASATSPAAQMFNTYDANGYLASEVDWNGNTTLYTHDPRGLEVCRTEAAGTADERTVTTQWDSYFRLPLQINEPGLTKSFTYDTNGNLLTETLTDTATNEIRTSTYTYNSFGQVLSMDGPRADVSDVTSYAYDTQGNLTSMTNALNQTTLFTNYDAHGNLLSMTDPNAVVTSFTYDERQRLTGITRAYGTALAATTSFSYDYAGNIKRVTQPNGAYIEYTYDKAYRVTDITDDLGNRISYQLDGASNIVGESVYDPANVLKRTQTAMFDDLSRLLESTGASSQTFSYTYDDQGNQAQSTDARLNSTGFGFDALNRLVSQTNPEFDTASFAYDDQDRLTQVTDERGLTTSYSYNGFGERVSQSSPDTGATTYDYDPAGNLIEQTDSRGETAQYQYDALNRLLSVNYLSDSSLNETYTYDQGSNGIGRLTGFSDFSGFTSFAYDELGKVVSDTRDVYGYSKITSYDYDLAANITEIVYPSGAVVAYGRDALGRIVDVDITQSPAGSNLSLVSNASYLPFGGITGFSYGNGLALTRQHDQDYRITQQTVSGGGIYQVVDYSYDANSNITDMDDLDDFTKSQLFQYDSLNRLYSEESDFYGEKTYIYDEVGNRTLRTLSPPGEATTNQTHTMDSNSNQLLSRGPRDYSYDVAGNTLAFDEPDGSPRREWEYSAAGRMEELRKFGELAARYQYNSLGQRVMKTLYQDNAGTPEEFQIFVFYYDQQGRLIQNSIYRPNGPGGSPRHMRDRQFIWMDDMPVGFLETVYRVNGNVLKEDLHYITADHLNTPTFATNQSGVITWKWDRDAFGLGELDLDPDGDGTNVNIRLRFPGQYDDEESITFYNYFRDYDPTIGRYMQSDPVGFASGSLNNYSYVEGNPTTAVDPYGDISIAIQFGGYIASAACSAAFSKSATEWDRDSTEIRDQRIERQRELSNQYYADCFERFDCTEDRLKCIESDPFHTDEVITGIWEDYQRAIDRNPYNNWLSKICGVIGKRPAPKPKPRPY